jgi:hypothetical protein
MYTTVLSCTTWFILLLLFTIMSHNNQKLNSTAEARKQRTLDNLTSRRTEQSKKEGKQKEQSEKEYEKQLEIEKRNPMCDGWYVSPIIGREGPPLTLRH